METLMKWLLDIPIESNEELTIRFEKDIVVLKFKRWTSVVRQQGCAVTRTFIAHAVSPEITIKNQIGKMIANVRSTAS